MFNLIRFVIICVLVYFAYRIVKWIFFSPVKSSYELPKRQESTQNGEELIQDPYCHIYMPISHAYKASIEGQELYFCSKKCCERYSVEKPAKKAQEAS
jgi:YHS domain-containing protein